MHSTSHVTCLHFKKGLGRKVEVWACMSSLQVMLCCEHDHWRVLMAGREVFTGHNLCGLCAQGGRESVSRGLVAAVLASWRKTLLCGDVAAMSAAERLPWSPVLARVSRLAVFPLFAAAFPAFLLAPLLLGALLKFPPLSTLLIWPAGGGWAGWFCLSTCPAAPGSLRPCPPKFWTPAFWAWPPAPLLATERPRREPPTTPAPAPASCKTAYN